jgi:hypothetical protein
MFSAPQELEKEAYTNKPIKTLDIIVETTENLSYCYLTPWGNV